MIDLHCHFLPGIDDGASTIEDSIALAEHAVNSGITHCVVTPHLHLGRYDNYREIIQDVFRDFKSALEESGIPLLLDFAAEVRICPEIISMVSQDKIPFLGSFEGCDVILLEMPHNQIPPGTDNMIRWLVNHNIRPMIAHPERNKEIMAEPLKVNQLVNAGALLQLTAGAVVGEFGSRCQVTAEYMLSRKMATILASDAHNVKHRPPELEPGRRYVEKLLGESMSWDLVLNTPKAITNNKFGDQT